MSHVEIVRAICFDRGLPIYKVERDLGFSNGYFNPKKTHDIPYSKLCKIADYLGVSVEVLTGTEDRIKKPASTDADGIGDKLSKLSPALRKQFFRFLELAKEDPDRAARFLEFAAQELESQK